MRLAAHPRARAPGSRCWPASAAASLVGLVNGFITLRGFNPIIVTIGTLSVLTGLAAVVAGGYTFPGLTQLEFMGTHRYLRVGETGETFPGIPAPVFIVAAVFVVGTIFLTRTRDGLRLMAVGANAEAVRRAGIPSTRYMVLGFVISGFLAAVGGLVNTANVTEANPAASPAIIFTALTAVALAGVALTGGRGSLPRVLVGALILATIANGLTIRGIQPYWATVATGALLLGSLIFERVLQTAVSERLMSANLSVHAEAGLTMTTSTPATPARRPWRSADIELHYGFVRALDGIDIHVMPGEVVALLGDNGAGKSTLLKVMSGAHRPRTAPSGCTAWSRPSTRRATRPPRGSRWSTRTSPSWSRRTSRPTSTWARSSCAAARSAGWASSTARRCGAARRPSWTGSASAPRR